MTVTALRFKSQPGQPFVGGLSQSPRSTVVLFAFRVQCPRCEIVCGGVLAASPICGALMATSCASPRSVTAYVTNFGRSNSVTPIAVATNTPGSPIPVGSSRSGSRSRQGRGRDRRSRVNRPSYCGATTHNA